MGTYHHAQNPGKQHRLAPYPGLGLGRGLVRGLGLGLGRGLLGGLGRGLVRGLGRTLSLGQYAQVRAQGDRA